ncbi:MAG: lysostaphin resistance A-like protein [Planctomycetota bacterium]|jgi:membrane protease YdiL (CAAX protease family)
MISDNDDPREAESEEPSSGPVSEGIVNLDLEALEGKSALERIRERRRRFIGPVRGPFILLGLMVLMLFAEAFILLPASGYFFAYGLFSNQLFNWLAMALVATFAMGMPLKSFMGIQRISFRFVAFAIGIGLFNLIAMQYFSGWLVDAIFTEESIGRQSFHLFSRFFMEVDTAQEKLWLFAVLVIGAPIAEEFLFRGFLQNLLVRWWKPWTGILVTTMIFTIVHYVPIRFPTVFELGLLLGIIYHFTGSIWAVVIIHMVTNGLGHLFLYFPKILVVMENPFVIVLSSLMLIILLIWFFHTNRRPAAQGDVRPEKMQWKVLFKLMIPCWMAAIVFGFMIGPIAGEGARVLKEEKDTLSKIGTQIDGKWISGDAAFEFYIVYGRCRKAVKEGRIKADAFLAWLGDVQSDQALLDEMGFEPLSSLLNFLRPDEINGLFGDAEEIRLEGGERGILPIERRLLDKIRSDVEARFGLDLPKMDQLESVFDF